MALFFFIQIFHFPNLIFLGLLFVHKKFAKLCTVKGQISKEIEIENALQFCIFAIIKLKYDKFWDGMLIAR